VEFLRARLPSRQEIWGVFSVLVFAVYSWEIRQYLFKFPSFLYYSTPGDLLSILSYMMAVALFESLLVAAVLVVIAAILPSGWYRDGFAYKGFLTVLILAVSSIQFQKYLPTHFPETSVIVRQAAVTGGFLLASIGLAHKVPDLQKLLIKVVDSISIMSFIYVPLGLLSLAVVIMRNLF
jgi:hypothetical protein